MRAPATAAATRRGPPGRRRVGRDVNPVRDPSPAGTGTSAANRGRSFGHGFDDSQRDGLLRRPRDLLWKRRRIGRAVGNRRHGGPFRRRLLPYAAFLPQSGLTTGPATAAQVRMREMFKSQTHSAP